MTSVLDLEFYQLENLIAQRVRFGLFYPESFQAMDIFKTAVYHKQVKNLAGITKEIKKNKWDFDAPIVLVSNDKWCSEIAFLLEKENYTNVCYYKAS